jgi:hypothetical protein
MGCELPSAALAAWERVALALFVSAALGSSVLPYGVAWRATPPDRVYAGSTDASADDYPTYLAKMRAGARGEWTYLSPYAPELERTIQIRPLYASIGALTAWAGAPAWIGYHAARLLLGAAMLLLLFAAARRVARSPAERWTSFTLASIGSGVGWIFGRDGWPSAWSYDLWVPELNAWYALLTNPHFPLATALVLGTAIGVARHLETNARHHALAAGFAIGLLAIVHAYDVFIATASLVAFGLAALATRRLAFPELARAAWLVGAAALLPVAWLAATYATDPSLVQMGSAQPVGPAWRVAAGLGLLLPLALVGVTELWRRGLLGGILAAWALVVPLLLVLPWAFPRRMVAGWHVPLGLAAGLGLVRLLRPIAAPRLRAALLVGVLALASLSTADILVYQVRRSLDPEQRFPTFLPSDLLDAYAWLQANARPRSVVLAPYGPSSWLPVYTDLCPFFGHWAEAPGAPARLRRVQAFYRGRSDQARAAFLRAAGIEWMLIGPRFREPGHVPIDTTRLPGARLVYQSGGVGVVAIDRRGGKGPDTAR